MNLEVQKPFEKDIENIGDLKLAILVNSVIEDLENCPSLLNFKNLKKMKVKGHYYRIRIGNYRLGLKQDGETLILIRFLHRKDIYTYFP